MYSVLVICVASLSIAWRRLVEHIGYNPIGDENIEERIDRIRIGLDDENAFSEDTTRTADGMTNNMNRNDTTLNRYQWPTSQNSLYQQLSLTTLT